MNPKKIWSNFGVSDLKRTATFYSQLGFKPNGANNSNELTSFLFGEDDYVIHFFLHDILEKNIKGELTDARKTNEIIFTLSAGSKKEVDTWSVEV